MSFNQTEQEEHTPLLLSLKLFISLTISLMNSHSISKTYTWSSEMGDYIGMESCVDLQQIEKVVAVDGGRADGGTCSRRRRVAATSEKKDYPPPIPWLARMEESPTATQMPWVLKRYRTDDGRLIITEEKVAHHEYFRARRSGGRLTLQLVHLDEDSAVVGDDEEEREDLVNVESNLDEDHGGDQCQGGKADGGDEIARDWNVEEGVAMRLLPEPVESGTVVLGGGGGGGKCCNYSGVRSNPCLFGMPLPAMKPVHI